MSCRMVVVDYDWFVHGQHRLVKQLAFCDIKTNTSHLYKLTLPCCLAQYGAEFARQAEHSHGLDWSEKGEYAFCRVDYVLSDIAERLGENREIYVSGLKVEKSLQFCLTMDFLLKI